jgi:3-hydroxyacyl-CoA dehydrogenase/enoyl-CoA hydratase/3-hydroxybutyryl-CoA epimerase/enoyl-CoA isomerase
MSYQGSCIKLTRSSDAIAELVFDNENESVNKFDRNTLKELREAVDILKGMSEIKGLMVTSTKKDFIVGADITEFGEIFKGTEAQLIQWMNDANQIFVDIEDLPYPSVSLVQGNALGGGFEMAVNRLSNYDH